VEQGVVSTAAFLWHLGDLFLNRRTISRKKMVWIGVGVGWSAFFLVKVLTKGGIIKE
jgi:hypothetical protein